MNYGLKICQGSDAPSSGNANVWVLSNQSWSALTDLTAYTTNGSGILVYVYEDVDYDGDTDLPINIRNSLFNSSDVTTYSVDNTEWGFYGNPFLIVSTMIWDQIWIKFCYYSLCMGFRIWFIY